MRALAVRYKVLLSAEDSLVTLPLRVRLSNLLTPLPILGRMQSTSEMKWVRSARQAGRDHRRPPVAVAAAVVSYCRPALLDGHYFLAGGVDSMDAAQARQH